MNAQHSKNSCMPCASFFPLAAESSSDNKMKEFNLLSIWHGWKCNNELCIGKVFHFILSLPRNYYIPNIHSLEIISLRMGEFNMHLHFLCFFMILHFQWEYIPPLWSSALPLWDFMLICNQIWMQMGRREGWGSARKSGNDEVVKRWKRRT